VQNLLNDKIEIERAGTATFVEEPGLVYGLSFSWAL
jgi:hypothetical protein